jgi:ABC-type branched-subunit amino acid transport system ATPase component
VVAQEDRMNSPLLETRSLTKTFGALLVTGGVDFRLERGERRALIGPNGAGKTTFVDLLTGVLRASGGSILLRGRDITRLGQAERVKQGVVRTFQINKLFMGLSLLENVCITVNERVGAAWSMLRPLGRHRAVIDEAMALLEDLQLADDAARLVRELPYGRQRLVEMAIALARKPQVLLLDEPAAGIPKAETSVLLRNIDRLPADIAVLMIDHDMDVVFRFAQRITVLVQGMVLTDGCPEEVRNDARVRDVYLGQRSHV